MDALGQVLSASRPCAGLQQLSQLSSLGRLNLRGCLGIRESSALRRLQVF